jgi:hypothetical protein
MWAIRLAGVGILIAPAVVLAGWFGPSDPMECVEKYIGQTRLSDAKRVIRRACAWGYGDNRPDDLKKVGACVVSDAENMYSKEATQQIIHRCANKYDSQRGFNALVDVLREDEREVQERLRAQAAKSRSPNPQSVAPSGPFTIMDMNTGELKMCDRVGNLVTCF